MHTGWILIDKYLGDALYACVLYVLLSMVWRAGRWRRAAAAMGLVSVIEVFQLTGIPAGMFAHGNFAVRVFARLLGTEFSFRDLSAYAVGIAGMVLAERYSARRCRATS